MGYSCFKTQQKLKGHWYWYLILQVSKRDRKKGKKMTLATFRIAFQVIMAEKCPTRAACYGLMTF